MSMSLATSAIAHPLPVPVVGRASGTRVTPGEKSLGTVLVPRDERVNLFLVCADAGKQAPFAITSIRVGAVARPVSVSEVRRPGKSSGETRSTSEDTTIIQP
jgi:hypothetical protein